VAVWLGLIFAFLAVGLGYWLSRIPCEREETWGCGFVRPTPRMQYTATSFAYPLAELFRFALRPRRHGQPVQHLFPVMADFEEESPDAFERFLFHPIYRSLSRLSNRVRVFQHGEIQLYLLYILVTLVALFVWEGR
jgi:hypothetical protein